jgi:hypothetical protein
MCSRSNIRLPACADESDQAQTPQHWKNSNVGKVMEFRGFSRMRSTYLTHPGLVKKYKKKLGMLLRARAGGRITTPCRLCPVNKH